ncbi:MAG: hypothetical protein ACOYOO_15060 [Saprospiraceae bacterium]
MQANPANIAAKALAIGTIAFLLAAFIYLLFQSRLQSDDLGFINYMRHHGGVTAFYIQMRNAVDAGIFMLVIGLPLFALSTWIPAVAIMLGIYGVLVYILFRALRAGIGYAGRTLPSRQELYLLALFFLLALVFTLWNRQTYQNAIFWFTGVAVYITSVCVALLALEAVIRRNIWTIAPLIIIATNTRINNLMVLGLVALPFLLMDWRAGRKNIQFWAVAVLSGLLGIGYYLQAPGLYKRLGRGAGSEMQQGVSDFLIKAFEGFGAYFTEPLYLLLFSVLFLLIVWAFPGISRASRLENRELLYFSLFALFVLYLHNLLLVFIFKADYGYGRIFSFSHLLFLISWAVLLRNTLYAALFEHIPRPAAVLLPLIFIAVFGTVTWGQLRWDIYKARRLAAEYDARYSLVERYRDTPGAKCMVFNRFSESGIIGVHDIPVTEVFGCGYRRTASWDYGDIADYDNWVFQQYYGVPFRIVTVERDVALPRREGPVAFDIQ